MSRHRSPLLAAAYAACRERTRHYENFPVGSLLFPRELRDHFHAVYAFARTADDFADEEMRTVDERLRLLDLHDQQLSLAAHGSADDPMFLALADTMQRFAIPIDPFQKLISAFRQDVTTTRYNEFSDVLDYCTRSANPVGEIVLRLFEQFSPTTAPLSDAICTALQLANFWQDVAEDFSKGRIYFPQHDLKKFRVDEFVIAGRAPTPEFVAMMRFEIERTATMFNTGAPLVHALHGRLRREIAAVLGSGRAVLQRIIRNDFDVLTKSNRLTNLSRMWIILRNAVIPMS